MPTTELVVTDDLVESEPNATEEVDDAEVEAQRDFDDRFFGRFGTFLVLLPETIAHGAADLETLYERLAAAVRADSRVTEFEERRFKAPFTRDWRGFPTRGRSTQKEILSGSDHFHALKFSQPFVFEVTVPTKNQPIIQEVDDAPTDRYWACWDGTTLFTIWRQDSRPRSPARSAGHVVEAVLRSAANSIGLALFVQACSPGCPNMFAHRTIRVDRFRLDDREPTSFEFDGEKPPMIRARLHSNDDELRIALGLHQKIAVSAFHFARYKNSARRLINTELLARRLTDELLSLDYTGLYGAAGGRRARMTARVDRVWKAITFRGRTRRARRIVDALWLAMARIETMQREWHDSQRYFNYYSSADKVEAFFDIDRKDDDDAANAVTTDFVRAAVEHRSIRRDNRVIVWATILGGSAGAVAAVVASLITAGR